MPEAGRCIIALWRKVRFALLACLLSLASMAAAHACDDTTPASTTGTSITFTTLGGTQVVCPTNDTVAFGLYGSPDGSTNPGVDANNNFPLTAGGTTFTNLNVTTGKATYTLVPSSATSNGTNAQYAITINSVSAGGTDTIKLYYASGCSASAGSCGGTSTSNTPFTITVNLSITPTVTSISPTSGPETGGTSVTITGTNFVNVNSVKFGATNATGFTVNSATQITATSPAGTGTVDVIVATATGTSAATAADHFTYVPAPTVTSLSPSSGPTAGGTSVTITGTNFLGATAVKFGATNATGFTVNAANQITATSPAGSGTVDVTVTTTGGTSATTSADQFTYVAAPTVTSISPTSGPAAGGTTVTINGTNFSGATSVTFGATGASFSVISATQITATSPAGTGVVDVRVTTVGGTSTATAADQFTYIAAPTVTSIVPTQGPVAGGTSVAITGTGFTGATSVTFGAVSASFTFNSATSITATSPAGTGVVDVRVTTSGGTSAIVAADQFTYVGAPTVTSISPNAGPTAGGTSVTITGTGFSTATAVKFGATNASSFTIDTATQITATSPAGTGTVDITVVNPGGTSAITAADQFTYAGAPTVTAVSPNTGATTGGTSVTITGTNLTGATSVTFGGVAATGVVVNSATSVTATSPAGAGTVDVRVTAPGGTSAITAADQFTYVLAPTVTSISPTSGPAPGGTTVTITGTNFTGSTAVKFGATNATSFTVNSATQITATSPAGTGTVDVTVTNNAQTSSASPADQFTYLGAPTVTSVSPASGPPAGGTIVTVSGTGFSGASAVKFGAANATSFTVNSATSITATSPAGTGVVDVTVTNNAQTSAVTIADRFTYASPATQTTLASSQNPSNFGQAVTFTATVTGTGGTPAGTVTFSDNGTPIGTGTLAAGIATFTTSALAVGSHSITASYGGSSTFSTSVSTALAQTVNVPPDSVRLRALQVNVTKVEAQSSGQAISGAIDNAISDGFSEGGSFMTPGGSGFHINFAAETDDKAEQGGSQGNSSNAYGSTGNAAGARGRSSRVDDAFAAINQQMPRKAPPLNYREPRDWLFWVDVRGTGVDRWNTSTTPGVNVTQSSLYGTQVIALMGLSYKVRPNFLVGVLGGYETFNYTEQDINGKLTGDGWTAGTYLAWRITPTLRYDAAVTYSGIGYNGVAGTAQGNFNGQRLMMATGLTGSYKALGLLIEPSAKVYSLWERENAYVDSLGTLQTARDFASGRASAGVKAIYPLAWHDGVQLAPYAGIYGDYYFTEDSAAAIALAGGIPLASTPLLDGWSARMTGGIGARFGTGAIVAVGGELGGIGSNTKIWTVSAKARVPFTAR